MASAKQDKASSVDGESATTELAALSASILAMREACIEAMRSVAEDSLTCELGSIATALENQKARADRLEERLARDRAAREQSIKDALAAAEAKLHDQGTVIFRLKKDLNTAISEKEAGMASLRKGRAEDAEMMDALRTDLADRNSASLVVLGALLQRPHRLMEIYGQDVYQAAKDTFTNLGGDPSSVPSPEPNRIAEAKAAEGDGDAS